MSSNSPREELPDEHGNVRIIPKTIGAFTLFIFKEIVAQKRWILLPVWIILAAVGLVILVGGATPLLPAIYIAF